jgi:Domain of unknown function (DUF4372)/Transposase DDE domain
MNRGRTVFAQLLKLVPFSHFQHLVDRFASNHGIRHFSAWSHFLCIAYSQLTRREGLRDLVACLNSQRSKLYPIGIRGKISRSTLADANERRDWRLFQALGHRLIATSVELYQGEDIGLGLKEPLYAMDSTTIALCLALFPWADFRLTKAAVKVHTIIDLRGAIPVYVHITTGKVHDVNVLDMIQWPAGATVVVDRGYLDFTRLQSLHQRQVSFVIRAKDNLHYNGIASREVDKSTGLRSDQTILRATPKSKLAYPDRLRRVSYRDPETDKFLVFLTNRFDLPALTIAEIYRNRWAVETIFQMAQTKLVGPTLFWQRHQSTDLDRRQCLSDRPQRSQTPESAAFPATPAQHHEVNMFEEIQIDQLVFDALMNFSGDPVDNQMILR